MSSRQGNFERDAVENSKVMRASLKNFQQVVAEINWRGGLN